MFLDGGHGVTTTKPYTKKGPNGVESGVEVSGMTKKLPRTPETKGIDHNKLPVGTVLSSPIKGDFLALPLFGWVAKRDKTETPLVMLVVLLLRSIEDPKPRGTLQIELPVLPETEIATVATLERLGWDGRVWPVDDGWPTGSKDDEEQIISLMEQASLRATMTFPPGEQGASTLTVSVQRARGPFLMPPLPEPEEGTTSPVKLQRLRELCENPRIFYNPTKPAVLH